MIKIILLVFIYTNILLANSFNFQELRYSDAIGKSIELEGQISFLKDGLKIFYPKINKRLEYEDNTLKYIENGQEIELDDIQSEQIMKYFDILILLHHGDEDGYDGKFEVTKVDNLTILKPIGMIKNYINNIEMIKNKTQLKKVKLFLKNSDYITINIDDEI